MIDPHASSVQRAWALLAAALAVAIPALAHGAPCPAPVCVESVEVDGKPAAEAREVPVRGPQDERERRIAISAGMPLAVGTVIEAPTRPRVRLRLVTANGSVLTLQPGGRLQIDDAGERGERFTHVLGEARFAVVRVLSFFEVSHERFLAAVRGTEFAATIDEKQGEIRYDWVKGEVVIEQEIPVVIGEADDAPDDDDDGPVFIERQILSAARPQLRYRLAPRQYLKIFRTYRDAEQFFRDQLAQDEKSGNPRQVQNGMLGLATILNAVGKPKEAVPLFERALALAAENRNTEREVRLCRRLGATYRDGLKDFAKATAMYQRTLAIQQRRTPSGASVGLAQAYTALGRTAGYAGDTSAWVASMEKAVAIHRRLDPGERRMTTAKGYKNLADAYGAAGRRDDALRVYRQTLALKQKLRPGSRDPSLARSLRDLGQSYVQLGNPAAGLPYLREALAMRVALFDGSHPSIATSHDDLGRAYARAGDPARALARFRQALDLRLKLYPDGAHPSLVRSYRNLAKAASDAGDDKAAEQYEARAKEMKEQLED